MSGDKKKLSGNGIELFLKRTSICFRYLFDSCILHNNLGFNILFVLAVCALASGTWSFIAVFSVLLIRGWILIKNYCDPIHHFTVYYICSPLPLLNRILAAALVYCLVFPSVYLVLLIIIHSAGSLAGIITIPVSLKLYFQMLGNYLSISCIFFFAAVYWPREQIKKLVSVLLFSAAALFLVLFIYLRIRMDQYFESFFEISDMEGLIAGIVSIFSKSPGGKIVFPLSFLINTGWFFILPAALFFITYRKLRNISAA